MMVMVAAGSDHGDHSSWSNTLYVGGSLKNGQKYYMEKNLSTFGTWQVEEGAEATLCLNGNDLLMRENWAITVSDGATLNVYDCSSAGTGRIRPKVNDGIGGISVAGTLKVYGGAISGVSLFGGVLEMSGNQKILAHQGSNYGGADINISINNNNNATGKVRLTGALTNTEAYTVYVDHVDQLKPSSANPLTIIENFDIYMSGKDPAKYFKNTQGYHVALKGGEAVLRPYIITFDANGGAGGTTTKDFMSGDSLDALPVLTREHYTFGGWYTAKTGGAQITAGDKLPDEDMTVYARWTPVNYNITYDLAGGKLEGGDNPGTYHIETPAFALKNPVRAGYVFTGWSGTGLTGNSTSVTIAKGSTGNRSYTANWTANTYTISYNLNGGALQSGQKNPIEYTVESNAITLHNPTQTGYTFAGWSGTGITGSSTKVTIAKGSTGDRSYAANWTANQYDITYSGLEGATLASANKPTKHTYGSSTAVGNPTKTGYTFAGWKVNNGGTAKKNLTLGATNYTEAITLTATWTANTYKVTFDYQGATGSTGTTEKSVTYNGTYGTLPAPVKTGYTFKGWFTQADGTGSQVKDTTPVKITAAQTLYAYWVDAVLPDKPVLKSGVILPEDWTNAQTTIPLTLSDNVGVTKLLVSIDGGGYKEVSDFKGNGTTAYDYSYTVLEGNHTYRFKAKDAAGNESPESEAFRVMLDTGDPAFSEGPTVKNVKADSAAITFTPSEGGKAYWIVDPAGTPADAQAVISGAQGSAQGGTQEITGGTSADLAVTSLTPGAVHKVYVVLEDAAGNLSEMKGVSFATLPEAPAITADNLIKDYDKETVKVSDDFGDVEVYTDPGDPSGSKIKLEADGYPVDPGKPVYIRYPEKPEGDVTVPPSAGVRIDIPGRPAAPPAKEVAVTGTTVTVKNPAAGEEYILVEKGSLPEGVEPDWKDADKVNEIGKFTGLDSNKEYDLYVRKKATEDAFASETAKTEVRTHVTINEPQIKGDGAGKDGNTAPKPDHPDEGGATVTYTGTYGEEYTPVIIVDGKVIIPGADTPDAEDSGMKWDEEDKKGEWKYVYEVPDGAAEADITVEFRKRAVIGITATPGSLTLSADDTANLNAIQAGNVTPLTAYLKEKCSVKAAYDNRTMEAVPADNAAYTVTDTFAPKGAAYHYTISAREKTCQTTLTVTPVTASVRNPDTVVQRQKDGGYTAQEVDAWLPAKLTVTYTGADDTVKTEELAVTWNTGSIGSGFGKTLGEKTVDGTVGLPSWATGTGSASIVIRFVDKTPLGDSQIRLTAQDFRYGDKKLPDAQGSITVEDTNPVYTYLYSADGGTTWTAKENLPKSAGGYIVPGEYQVKMNYTGDQYIGEKTTSFTVAKKQLTVQPGTLAAQDKNYDGTLNAVLKEDGKAALSGIVEGDNVTLGGTLTARFTEAGPKKNIPVTVTGFLLEGADSRYYELDNAALTLHATINNADGTPPSDGKKPDDGKKPGGGKNPDDGKKPGDGKNPDDGKKPEDGTKPSGADGGKGGSSTKPGGTDSSEGNGSDIKPGDGSNSGEGETKIVSAVIEDGKIVIDSGNHDGEDRDTDDAGNGETGVNGAKIATGNVPGMAGAGTDRQGDSGAADPYTASTMLNVGEGAVIVRVVCEEPKLTAGVADTVAVANAVLTKEQIQLVGSGDTIEIRVEVKDITQSVSGQDQEVIESAVTRLREEQEGMILGMYVDISMFVKVGEGEWNAVTRSDEPVEVVIGIPEELRSDGREYYIIRSHEGECDILTDMDDAPDTITISTDRFSSYAIAYAETDGTGADGTSKCGLCHICPTFLGICCFVWLALIIVVIVIVILLVLRRKKEDEPEGKR